MQFRRPFLQPGASSLSGGPAIAPAAVASPLVSPIGAQSVGDAAFTPPSIADEGRARLADAIVKATGGGQPQEVQHPMQALGNATQQIAGAYQQRKQAPTPRPGSMAGTKVRNKLNPIRPGSGQIRRPTRLKPLGG